MTLREDANFIIQTAIQESLPDEAVKRALLQADFSGGKTVLLAAGKAAWQMAKTAWEILGSQIEEGVVITKYDHSKGSIGNFRIFEAGHPVPDHNSFLATEAAIELVSGLSAKDRVLFLLSGGGSALFEKPLVSKEELEDVTKKLLACGADIVEMNTIRKRLSAVKGGRFAKLCESANVFAVVLSDIIGNPLDMIASGPACADTSTCEQALAVLNKYKLKLSDRVVDLLHQETPKVITNVKTHITGSVSQLCDSAAYACRQLGYETVVLTDQLCCQAKEAGAFLASIARYHENTGKDIAFIAGGETVVNLTGKGKGGRNQELALAAAPLISGLSNAAVFSVGSDGTDGPTDAAGGYVDGNTQKALAQKGIVVYDILKDNNAYFALKECDGLIMTGATGTNVNDVAAVLIRKKV